LPAEPWDDSSLAEALGSLAAGTWRPGRTLRVVALASAEATYAVVALRRLMGKRGTETERPPRSGCRLAEGRVALRWDTRSMLALHPHLS
jgi:hypothetical protein